MWWMCASDRCRLVSRLIFGGSMASSQSAMSAHSWVHNPENTHSKASRHERVLVQ